MVDRWMVDSRGSQGTTLVPRRASQLCPLHLQQGICHLVKSAMVLTPSRRARVMWQVLAAQGMMIQEVHPRNPPHRAMATLEVEAGLLEKT